MGITVVSISRTQSGRWQARKNIPAAVREAYGKWEEKKTWDASLTAGQAKAEAADWVRGVEARIDLLKATASAAPANLSQLQTLALAGEWYKAERDKLEKNPGRAEDWYHATDELVPTDPDEREAGRIKPTEWLIEKRDKFLRGSGIRLSPSSSDALIQEMGTLWFDLSRLMERRIDRDYSPDPMTDRLPAFELEEKRVRVSITQLFEDYAATGMATARTIKGWRSHVSHFVSHLGHDDAAQVTPQDVNGWVKALTARGLSPKTVKGSYLAVINIIMKIAEEGELIASNPAAKVTVRGKKSVQTRGKSLTDAEAETILRAALTPQPLNISEDHRLARRWVPWVLAYTGARAGEITQLRRSDIRKEDGVWVIRITPDAGTVKNRKYRFVPIHSHLLDMRFHELSKEGDHAPLFYNPAKRREGSEENHHPRKVAEHVGKWVRSLGIEGVQPNHGWRHRFKTVARAAGVDPEARDALQGHAPKSQGQAYGEWPLDALRAEVEKLERYKL
ncbi:tyrosine-type recombinase/integrase [Erythrobacter sp. Alg231-14]|uniref:tyrosine-type recombinase/integrase n=1 Tax=Erythrobacter sp. Alg231-14 TaxID=1922225 RepID=UPI000D55D617